MVTPSIHIGMNGRFFSNNWRPAIDEIAFAHDAGFTCMQFGGPAAGLDAEQLGADLEEVAACLGEAGITAVMEIPIIVNARGRTADGRLPADILQANLPAIQALNCGCVHYHLVLRDDDLTPAIAQHYEEAITPDLAAATKTGEAVGFRFGIEHNEPDYYPFNTPESCARALSAVPDLGLVWDFNHATSEQVAGYKALTDHITMLHISDTPLPAVNYHWPLGRGDVDFVDYCCTLLQAGFAGPAILEIGGLPKSGGYGQDTDEALTLSRRYLAQAIKRAMADLAEL